MQHKTELSISVLDNGGTYFVLEVDSCFTVTEGGTKLVHYS